MIVRFIVDLEKSIEVPTESYLAKEEPGTQSPTQSDSPILKLLLSLQDGEKASGELRSILNIKHRPTFRDNYLHPALDAGFIEMTIPEKPSSRLQKYRLTPKGLTFLTREKK
jgi:hypothetical protein